MLDFDLNHPKYWYTGRIKSEIDFLRIFIDDIESQVDLSIAKYLKDVQTVVIEEDFENNIYETVSIYKDIDDQAFDLDSIFKEYFPNLQRSSALITLFGFMENELDHLCFLMQKRKGYKVGLNDMVGKGLKRSINYLNKVGDFNIETDGNEWIEINKISDIRNLFVHNQGSLIDPSGSDKVKERKFVDENQCLGLDGWNNKVIVNKGYLISVLNCFDVFLKNINVIIQQKYKIPDSM